MSAADIQVHEAGKCYKIFSKNRDRVKQVIRGDRKKYFQEFWAVRNVSFELHKGEAMGIIGKNGSGKSTLLQMICGTLRATEGEIETKGRIAALLELGSGFNPEFTGIENVYLNASLLGLSKQETTERLEDILAFADIGEFAYQPVKAYSSGMAVRLAFAVIAHVEAEILIVDEALAVGDAYFTQKCMRFIQRHREKNCLLFVSHDASSIMSICDKAMLIEGGRLQSIGAPKQIITDYMRRLHSYNREDGSTSVNRIGYEAKNAKKVISAEKSEKSVERWSDYRREAINASREANWISVCRFDESVLKSESFGSGKAQIVSVDMVNKDMDLKVGSMLGGEVVLLEIKAKTLETIRQPIVGFILKNDKGLTLLGDNTLNMLPSTGIDVSETGEVLCARFMFTLPLLPAGEYVITASIAEGTQDDHALLHWVNDALVLRSECTSIAAGLAGVAMHDIKLTREERA